MLSRIVFMGSDPLAIPLLESILNDTSGKLGRLVGIVTQPDKAKGRGKKVQPAVLRVFAEEHGLPCLQPEKWNTEAVTALQSLQPEVLLVLAYGHILRQPVLDLALGGAWNFHASLLPALRGSSPIETVIAAGESETGMTLMSMVRKLDAGPILGQEKVAVHSEDTALVLREKLARCCVPLWERYSEIILSGRGKENAVSQDEQSASYCRMLHKQDGWMDFNQKPVFWERRARAFAFWPGISFGWKGERIKVEGVSVESKLQPSQQTTDTAATAGTVLAHTQDGLLIACGSGVLRITHLQKPGGKMLPAAEFLRGFSLPVGSVLESFPVQPLICNQPFRYQEAQ